MRTHLGLVGALVVALAGCTASMGESADGGDGGDDANGEEERCEGPLGAPKSPSTIEAMTACCTELGGQAHCLPNVPEELKGFVAECGGGGYCLPDSFLESGGAEPPAQCTAFGGSGVCLSKCIPDVAANMGILEADTCTNPDDLCVPCVSPIDGMPTGACDILELAACVGDEPNPINPVNSCDDPATCDYEASCPPVIDASSLTACGVGAHCVGPALIPAEYAAQLGTCEGSTDLCVPDIFIETGGKFTAATCDSVNNAEGRCLSVVLPAVADQADLLPQATCETGEKCTPCFDPISGMPTGACSLSCDTGPTEAPTTLQNCCGGAGKCVPRGAVPEDQTDQLAEDSCEDIEEDAYYCVPNEILQSGPFPTCTADSFILGEYTGVCLSDCLDFGIQGIALAGGTCADDYKCAPCELNGEPTGAPGCPP